MALESGVRYISDLVQTNPTDGDALAQGDNHIRNIKAALKGTFPRVTGSSQVTQADFTKLKNVTVSSNAINTLEGIQGNVQSRLHGLETSKFDADQFTSENILNLIKSVDGDQSGLNADLIDGKDLDFLRNASNLNSGTIPFARLSVADGQDAKDGSSNTKVMTPASTDVAIKNYVPSVANNVEVLLSSQTWTVPSGVRDIFVVVVGAGGGGDDDDSSLDGQYGAVAARHVISSPGEQFVVQVGQSAAKDQRGPASAFGGVTAYGGAPAKDMPAAYPGAINGRRVDREHLVAAISSVPCDFSVQNVVANVFKQQNKVQNSQEGATPYGLGGTYLPGCPGGNGAKSSISGAIFVFYFKQ